MAVNIINSENSFVRFSETGEEFCYYGTLNYCLPVYESNDVHFQFIVNMDTPGEVECLPATAEIQIGLVRECGDEIGEYAAKPERFRLSETQILYNWSTSLPGFDTIAVGECFKIQVTVFSGPYLTENTFCSNCFERISDPCFTSVIEYGNDEDAYGFKYCTGGGVEEEPVTCEPTYIQFTNVATLSVPYTAQLQAKYGNLPNVQTWIYDPSGVLTNMGIQATFDAYPPTVINFDFGGLASGIIILR